MNQGPERNRLTRSSDRKVAGVAGGVAEYLATDPTIVRLLWIVAAFVSLGLAVVAYVLLWVAMPETDDESETRSPDRNQALLIVLLIAVIAVFAGGFGPGPLFDFDRPRLSWALLLVVAGVVWLLLRSRDRREP